MTTIELAEKHSEMPGTVGELACALLRACEALSEISRYNRVRNDLEAYLADVAEWGMGEMEDRPNPTLFGLQGAA
jgi:hypothetical protein